MVPLLCLRYLRCWPCHCWKRSGAPNVGTIYLNAGAPASPTSRSLLNPRRSPSRRTTPRRRSFPSVEDLSGYAVLDSGATETVASHPALEALRSVRAVNQRSSSLGMESFLCLHHSFYFHNIIKWSLASTPLMWLVFMRLDAVLPSGSLEAQQVRAPSDEFEG